MKWNFFMVLATPYFMKIALPSSNLDLVISTYYTCQTYANIFLETQLNLDILIKKSSLTLSLNTLNWLNKYYMNEPDMTKEYDNNNLILWCGANLLDEPAMLDILFLPDSGRNTMTHYRCSCEVRIPGTWNFTGVTHDSPNCVSLATVVVRSILF